MKNTMKKKVEIKKKTDFDYAIKLSEQVQLDDVRLISCKSNQEPCVLAGKNSFSINHFIEVEADKEQSYIFIVANFDFEAFKEGHEKEDSFAKIKASFLLSYKVESLEGINDKCLTSFGKLNGVYNAWPYWREFVQNMIVRMGLPTLTIPVFRLFEPKIIKQPKKKVLAKDKVSAKKAKLKKVAKKKTAKKKAKK